MNRRLLGPLLLGLLVTTACGSDLGGSSESPTPFTAASSSAGLAATATLVPTLQPAHPPAATPPPAVVDRLKADLAGRLKLTPNDITAVSLSPMTWPDGCLGIGGPGVVCTQALVPGWLAVLRAPDGQEYRYHGSGDRFALEP